MKKVAVTRSLMEPAKPAKNDLLEFVQKVEEVKEEEELPLIIPEIVEK
jgi:hypothetical protein